MRNDFLQLIQLVCERERNDHFMAMGFGIVMGGFLVWMGTQGIELLLLVGGGFIIYGFHMGTNFKDEKYWLDKIQNASKGIIYIKPIKEKHTVALVLTLYTRIKFKIHELDGNTLMVDCRNEHEVRIFYDLVSQYLPNTQFGYSSEIESLFNDSREDFIKNLKKNGLYTPMSLYQQWR